MTPPTAPERCTHCDDPRCEVPAATAATNGIPGFGEVCSDEDDAKWAALGAATRDCGKRPAVDWRARAIAAEARIATVAAEIEHDVGVKRSHDHGRATGGQTCGTGGPLTGAPQSMLRYLDRVVRDLHDERTRAIADHAAQWAKVAPLIERLADDVRRRELIARAEFDRRVSDTVTAMLAATEATP